MQRADVIVVKVHVYQSIEFYSVNIPDEASRSGEKYVYVLASKPSY